MKVGGSLTLTCDTDANPAPTTYSSCHFFFLAKQIKPKMFLKKLAMQKYIFSVVQLFLLIISSYSDNHQFDSGLKW